MSTSKGFHPPYRQGIKIIVDEKDFLFSFKIDPREYFYPLLLVTPNSLLDYDYWKEEGMSKEKYEHQIKWKPILTPL